MPGEVAAGNRRSSNGNFLSGPEMSPIGFRNARYDFPAAHIRNLGERLARASRISDLEGRQLLSVIQHVLVAVRLDIDVAAGLRLKHHTVDSALRILRGDLCSLHGRR